MLAFNFRSIGSRMDATPRLLCGREIRKDYYCCGVDSPLRNPVIATFKSGYMGTSHPNARMDRPQQRRTAVMMHASSDIPILSLNFAVPTTATMLLWLTVPTKVLWKVRRACLRVLISMPWDIRCAIPRSTKASSCSSLMKERKRQGEGPCPVSLNLPR